ncbi:VWFA domain-containing protein [Pseudoscourfieldia marina]
MAAAARAPLSSSLPLLATEDVPLVSHLHGRMRRAERGIDRTELKRAVKYGKRSRANPGRNGQPRWKYVHNDIVYITDETSRHEITSWRTRDDDAEEEDEAGELNDDVTVGATGTHVVIIVDDSGSMRTNDIPGYEHRKQAVYNCLKKDFFLPQVATAGDAKVSTHGEVFASLIRFNDEATVIFERVQADKEVSKKVMLNKLDKERNKRARSHGNYLPALRAADELLAKDSRSFARLMVLLLSDGAPSDHQEMECKHGTMVWRSFGESLGKVSFIECPTGGRRCRWLVKDREQRECVEWAKKLATKYGEDRVVITTVAFGDPKQNFSTLEKMAQAIPRGSFQKLGLSSLELRTAFSSLTSTLTTLRTEGGSIRRTPRAGIEVRSRHGMEGDELEMINRDDGDWWIYDENSTIRKYVWNGRRLDLIRLHDGAVGMAFEKHPFAEGVERFTFRCVEITPEQDGGDGKFLTCGNSLVAKEAKIHENLTMQFQKRLCRVQYEASQLAEQFNRRLASGIDEWYVSFLDVCVYMVEDESYESGVAWILAEDHLDGRFEKWNNNAGHVKKKTNVTAKKNETLNDWSIMETLLLTQLDAIVEEEEDNENGTGFISIEHERRELQKQINKDDVPQAFSHFTYEATGGTKLVCDLQGVWNSTDGFRFTDPVIHQGEGKEEENTRSDGTPDRKVRANGPTDRGDIGIANFFRSHECNEICRRLGLKDQPLERHQQQCVPCTP